MKKLALFLALVSLASAKMNYEELDKKFEEIAKERVTIDSENILRVNNPFNVPNAQQSEQVVFHLQAIVENRSKINGKWFKPGDEVASGFRVTFVRNGIVGLSDFNTYKELNLKDNQYVRIFKK